MPRLVRRHTNLLRVHVACFALLIANALMVACGGSNAGMVPGPSATVSIASSTTTAMVTTGASQMFSVSVSGSSNTGVTWSIQEGASGGTIDAGGKYTAPSKPGIYHIVATSTADPSKSVIITVTVVSGQQVSIAISPASVGPIKQASIFPFVASFAGTINTGVIWSMVEGSAGGTIDSSGHYTAPNTSGTFHVVATSAADPTRSATATVTVGGPGIVVTVGCSTCFPPNPANPYETYPLSLSVTPGSQQQFGATVTGTTNTAVTWSLMPVPNVTGSVVSGTIDASGRFTAGTTETNLYVVAQSVADPTVSGVAMVVITTNSYLTQAEVRGGLTNPFAGGTGQFYAAVGDRNIFVDAVHSWVTVNVGAIWSIQEGPAGGTIDANGVYTAPPVAGTYHIVLTIPSMNLTATAAVTTLGLPTGYFSASTPTGSWTPPGPSNNAVVRLTDTSFLSFGGYGTCAAGICTATNVAGEIHVDGLGNVSVAQVGNLNQSRANAAVARLQDGRVLVVGGVQESSQAGSTLLNSAELYDPVTKTFAPTGSMSVVRCPPKAIALQDGRVLVVGPETCLPYRYTSPPPGPTSAEIYDPRTGSFGAKIPISPLYQSPLMVLLPDGRVLLAGAGPDTYGALLFDPKTDTFSPTSPMIPGVPETATVLADGTVLFVGWSYAQIYDPKTGTFSTLGKPMDAAGVSTSVLLPNGKVVIGGGGQAINQIYDPQTRSFSYGTKAEPYLGGYAFAMPNGTVFYTDGVSSFAFYHP